MGISVSEIDLSIKRNIDTWKALEKNKYEWKAQRH